MRKFLSVMVALVLVLTLVPVMASNSALAATLLISEDFEGGAMPAGWTTGGFLGNVEVLEYEEFSPDFPAPSAQGDYAVLLSNGPGEGSPENADLDGNGYDDYDTSTLSFDFELTPAEVPATLGFQWSFLTSDEDEGPYDDFFMVTLNGANILSGSCPGTSASLFTDVPPLDGVDYTVYSDGDTDESNFDDGATSFQTFSYTITSPDTYTLEFLVADQSDNAADSGLLIDDVLIEATEEALYAADGAGGNPNCNLYILDPATGAVSQTIGPIGYAVTGLAFAPDGTLYGVTGNNAPVEPHSLITINTTTGAGTLIGDELLGNYGAADISFSSGGTLYGWSEQSDDLVTINLGTGQATIVGESGIGTAGSGLAFDSGGTLWFTGDDDNGLLRTIDPSTGLPTDVVMMDGSGGNRIGGLACNAGDVLYGARKLGSGSSAPCDLITINTTTGHITSVGMSVTALDSIVFSPSSPPPPPPTGGSTKDRYLPKEDVRVIGSGFPPDSDVDVYVVGDGKWLGGETIADYGITAMETLTADGDGEIGGVIWEAPLQAGEYDIVFDAGQNGDYDALWDFVDDPNHPGFIVTSSVGGEVHPVNKAALLMPWLGLGLLLALAAGGLVLARRRSYR